MPDGKTDPKDTSNLGFGIASTCFRIPPHPAPAFLFWGSNRKRDDGQGRKDT